MSETEAEDRTQAPSKQRRQMAREHGQVAHSRELTAAIGLLGASIAIACSGRGLAEALLGVLREPFLGPPAEGASPAELVARLRQVATAVGGPVLLVASASFVAAVAAHQAQVRGLWAPALLAPDPSRLWKAGQGPGFRSNLARGVLGLVKVACIALLAAWMIRSEWSALPTLAGLDVRPMAALAAAACCRLLVVLALGLLTLGAVDFGLTHMRFEASLRTTPDQQREEQRSLDGDPALRARRRQVARAWQLDGGEALQGDDFLLNGPAGLTIVVGGGPPPARMKIKAITIGAAGERLRESAARRNFPAVDHPELARTIAGRRPPSLPLTPELVEALTSARPAPSAR